MPTAKEEVRKILEHLPDDATFEQIQYHIYVCEKVRQGLKEIEGGRTVPQEEAEAQMSKWLK